MFLKVALRARPPSPEKPTLVFPTIVVMTPPGRGGKDGKGGEGDGDGEGDGGNGGNGGGDGGLGGSNSATMLLTLHTKKRGMPGHIASFDNPLPLCMEEATIVSKREEKVVGPKSGVLMLLSLGFSPEAISLFTNQ